MSKLGLYVGNNSLQMDDDNYFVNVSYENLRQILKLDHNLFEIVVLDKILQKLDNFDLVLDNCKKLLKNLGQLIIIVPDYKLYEKCFWPSRYNKSHKQSFSLNLTQSSVPRATHWNVEENLIPIIKSFGFVDFEVILDDNNFDYDLPILIDQTKDGASCYIIIKCQLNKENENE